MKSRTQNIALGLGVGTGIIGVGFLVMEILLLEKQVKETVSQTEIVAASQNRQEELMAQLLRQQGEITLKDTSDLELRQTIASDLDALRRINQEKRDVIKDTIIVPEKKSFWRKLVS